MISSPYDPDARYSTKRSVEWVGYKVHLTETCEAVRPHLIVNVETTPATTPDDNMLEVVHASLAPRQWLPSEHLVDKGYTSAQVLLDSQREYHVAVVGPVADDPSWQTRAGEGFDKAHFHVDWERHVVTCPVGKQSLLVAKDDGAWDQRGGAVLGQRLYAVRPSRSVHASEKGAAHHCLILARAV